MTVYYGLVYFPDAELERINSIRRKYDPTVGLIDPHITVMFLVPAAVGENELVQHIENVLAHQRPFPIRLHGLRKSWDHWLLLTLAEGNSDVIQLYRRTYTGILAQHRRDDIEFIPHLSLGMFAKHRAAYDPRDPQRLDLDEQLYERALREAEALQLDIACVVDKLHLVKITEDLKRVVWTREFPLRGSALE